MQQLQQKEWINQQVREKETLKAYASKAARAQELQEIQFSGMLGDS
jgi:hypothetical protein